MTSSGKKRLIGMTGSIAGAALLACTGLAQSAAAAAGEPEWVVSSFYTEAGFKGTEMLANLDSEGCQDLSAPANSVINMNDSRKGIVYYYQPDCQGPSVRLDDLRTVTLSASPILSYQVFQLS
ncbi:hypothetical protein FB570_11745 [Streptomyces sp. T12]|uniref:hypothetical protein n=1 Tax=Streptomyces sp. T12 TaxID=477697 RepID=UPI0011A2BE49|nr:hypothetical protein [Streptomyces sp. T12]TWD13553.1 hypothetical protein FB570_11745 [Streptomyces sp. T12]